MRGRKLLALALCAALTMGLTAPALAAEAPAGQGSSDQALMTVTAKVKEALELDTEIFTDFQGWAEEDALLGKRWSLEWAGDGVRLSITADDQGKVYSYNRFDSVSEEAVVNEWYMGGKLSIPRLPEDKSTAAFQTAQAFLDKVLQSGLESVKLENRYAPSLHQDTYRYSGQVLLHGLPSPITCSITVRASDLAVTRFWRGDQGAGYVGGVPSPTTTRSEEQARSLLRSTLDMKAQYVLEEDGKTAMVRYVPLPRDEYYVDGKSGQLVNLTALYDQLRRSGGGATNNKFLGEMEAAADMSTTAGSLTKAEQDGAAILTGALSKEDIDKALKKAWPEMGLGNYTLSAASYSVAEKDIPEGQERTPEDYTVSCRLTYSKQEGQTIRSKVVTVEAKTGQVKSLWSSRSYRGEDKDTFRVNVSFADARPTADTIMQSFAGPRSALLALAESVDAREKNVWEHLYTYQHTAGGYFYPSNYYTIGVDATDGTISRMEHAFDDTVALKAPQKVVTKDQAIDTYLSALAAPYGYLEVPVSISLVGHDIMPLLKEAGYHYVESLKPGYTLAQPEHSYVDGVYAESGEAVVRAYEPQPEEGLSYDDLEGHWVETAANALAHFSIGLRGGSLNPSAHLTQLDMIALLVSVDGYIYDSAAATERETDDLYERAYTLGLVTPETRDEDKIVTRGELVKLILDAAGYDRIAALKGIFRCDFADAGQISTADMGYAALAQGLGLVNGGSGGVYAPNRQATRAEAVAMLYQYMK